MLDRTLKLLHSMPAVQKLIQSNIGWKHIRRDVALYIKNCPCCQKMAFIKPLVHTKNFTISSGRPFQRLAMDYIEGLPADEDGNDCISCIICCFSRFIVLKPTKSTKATGAANSLLQWCAIFGNPLEVISDQGSQYTSKLHKELLELLGVEPSFTLANSKQENGIVERSNRETFRHLKNIIFDRRIFNKWGDFLPIVQSIMNNAVHTSLGVSPASVIFGLHRFGEGTLFTETPEPLRHLPLSNWMEKMLNQQSIAVGVATEHLNDHKSIHVAKSDGQDLSVFSVGSYVLVTQGTNFRKGPTNKLLPFNKGPLLVEQYLGEDKYLLRNLVTGRAKAYFAQVMIPFVFDPTIHNPTAIAGTDVGAFIVERIVSMRGNVKKKTSLEFKIHWLGLDDSEDTYESWKTMRANAVLHAFLRAHKKPEVRKLLPKQFENPPEVIPEDNNM